VKVKGGNKQILKGALALILILGLATLASALTCPKVLQAQFCVDGDDTNSCVFDTAYDSFLVVDSLYVTNQNSLMKIDLNSNLIEWGRRIALI